MASVFSALVLMLGIMLIPLVPAYILYSRLPSNTIVNGPFRGLTVHLTGAFGGYFIVVLLGTSIAFAKLRMPGPEPEYQAWLVRGKLIAPGDNSFLHTNDAFITLQPAIQGIDENGSFFTVIPMSHGLLSVANHLRIEKQPFAPVDIPLGPNAGDSSKDLYHIVYDSTHYNITIDRPVQLHSSGPAYEAATAFTPRLVPASPLLVPANPSTVPAHPN